VLLLAATLAARQWRRGQRQRGADLGAAQAEHQRAVVARRRRGAHVVLHQHRLWVGVVVAHGPVGHQRGQAAAALAVHQQRHGRRAGHVLVHEQQQRLVGLEDLANDVWRKRSDSMSDSASRGKCASM